MSVNFRPNSHFEEFINSLITSGRYSNKTEIMHAALRSLEDAEHLREARLHKLKTQLALGDEDIDEGRILTYETPEDLANAIKTQGRDKLNKMRKSG
ncbi:MAG: type II toxin-antitoxin system ParD family antitoxin [Pseudomonadota bacterium]